jgi:hypothetical protein
MSNDAPEGLGRLDDGAEKHEPSDDAADGAAARGEYDPTEGSPGQGHPVGEDFPDEAVRFDEGERPRTETHD